MGYSKRQFIQLAFSQIGLASYVQPEQEAGALLQLDAMMAAWNSVGIRIGYPLPSSPQNSDIDAETGVPDAANQAIYLNLAVLIAPSIGKEASPATKALAKSSYDSLSSRTVTIVEMTLPTTMPIGQGNKPMSSGIQFILPTDTGIDVGPDGKLDLY